MSDINQEFVRLAAATLAERAARILSEHNRYEWRAHARPSQLAPGTPGSASPRKDWRYWFLCSGRGFGKTRTGAETVREQVRLGRRRRIAFVAPTYDSGRKLMIEGPSGILSVSPEKERPVWLERHKELHWPNGAIGYLYTSEKAEGLRGPEHDFAWCEEVGAWQHPDATWNNLRLGMRIAGPRGDHPQSVITSTPRPTTLVRKLLSNPKTEVTGGSTYENKRNLDDDFLEEVLSEYEGTRLGEQELHGKLLDDTPGAMWKMSTIEPLRIDVPPFEALRMVVGVDPAVADAETKREARDSEKFLAETGIVVAGRALCRCRGKEEQHGFVYEDLSGFFTPETWAGLVVGAYHKHNCDRIIAEVNNGGALVEATIRACGGDRAHRVAYKAVTASRGKQTRAEPVAALYERGQVHHIGVHAKLEDQMTTWNPLLSRRSPDRMDAMVWALTDLLLGARVPALSSQPFSVPRRL